MPLYRLANTGASEVFAVFGGKIPRTPLRGPFCIQVVLSLSVMSILPLSAH